MAAPSAPAWRRTEGRLSPPDSPARTRARGKAPCRGGLLPWARCRRGGGEVVAGAALMRATPDCNPGLRACGHEVPCEDWGWSTSVPPTSPGLAMNPVLVRGLRGRCLQPRILIRGSPHRRRAHSLPPRPPPKTPPVRRAGVRTVNRPHPHRYRGAALRGVARPAASRRRARRPRRHGRRRRLRRSPVDRCTARHRSAW
jgi:hypothetical protein